jgi:hypothetical protein
MGSRAACLLAIVAVALTPATALAQGAGDDQYSDPFAGEAPAATATPAPAPPATPPPAAEPAPEAPVQSVAEPEPRRESAESTPPAAPAAAAGSATAQQSAAQLPYTGADAGLVGVAGAFLLAGGVALRLRVRVAR